MIFTALCALAPLTLFPQEDAPSPESILSFRFEGLDSLFVDPKDATFLNALKMLDDRLLELPGEFPEFDVPLPALSLATRLLAGTHSLAVALSPEPILGMPLPVMVDLRFGQGSSAAAMSLQDDLTSFLGMMGMPFEAPEAGALMALPAPVPAWMGASASDFVVRLGSESGLELPAAPSLLPEGARVSSSGMMDYGRLLTELFAMAELEMGGTSDPEFDAIKTMLGTMGLNDLNYRWATGSDSERQYISMNVLGWAANLQDAGVFPKRGFGQDLMRVVPADATWVSALSLDLGGVYKFYEEMFYDLGEDFSSEVAGLEAEIGMSIYDDILSAFGSKMVVYASDSTGGGGTMSMVGIMELQDQDKFLALVTKMGDLVNSLSIEEANGYVHFGNEETEQSLNVTLNFPGIPIPFELTLSVTGSYAVIGMTPQAVAAAVHQIVAPSPSLLDNPSFQVQKPDRFGDLFSLYWIDTPRLMGDGFGAVSLATSALANAVRSPIDPKRQPGMLLSTLPELRKGAKGILMMTYADGPDLMTEYRMDRSQLVNAAGLAGFVYNSPILPLLSVALTAVPMAWSNTAQSLEVAEYGVVEADLEMLYAALEMYAMSNGGAYPETLQALQAPDANGQTFLSVDWDLLDPWGETYYYIPPADEDFSPVIYSSSYDPRWGTDEYDYGDYDYYGDMTEYEEYDYGDMTEYEEYER